MEHPQNLRPSRSLSNFCVQKLHFWLSEVQILKRDKPPPTTKSDLAFLLDLEGGNGLCFQALCDEENKAFNSAQTNL